MEDFLRHDLEFLFVFIAGQDSRNGAHEHVGIPVGTKTAVVEIAAQAAMKALEGFTIDFAELSDLPCGSAPGARN